MSATASTHPAGPSLPVLPTLAPALQVGIGALLLSVPLIAILIRPEIGEAASIYLRVFSACGGALIGAVVPGLLNVRLPVLKAGGALAVFAAIFLLDPPHAVSGRIGHAAERRAAEVTRSVGYTTWLRYGARLEPAESLASIGKPAGFPERFVGTRGAGAGRVRLTYDAGRKVFVEETGEADTPYWFFRMVRYDNGVLWLYDDNRRYAMRLPEAGGWCEVSEEGVDGPFRRLYQVKVG
ncbi:MAG TPA: hypothetical protein VGD81_09065 [Opitutaceae bacterium]